MKYLLILITFLPIYCVSQEPTGEAPYDQLKVILDEEKDLQNQITSLADKAENLKLEILRHELKGLGLPSNAEGETIWHKAMVLSYNEEHEQANWVYHQIHPDVVTGNVSRTNDFRVDPLVTTKSADQEDYFLVETGPDGKKKYDGYGYDRGHLAPSADFRWSETALSESYFYSNMSPQSPDLNRERWAELEGMLRAYVSKTEAPLYVVTGPVLFDGMKKVDRSVNGLSLPDQYYKVVVDPANKTGIGFVFPNSYCKQYVRKYAVSIDSVERLTGIDFFPELENAEDLEANKDVKDWLPGEEQKDVDSFTAEELPKKAINAEAAKDHMDTGKKVTVCGTVVSTKESKQGNVFLNLDRSFPNHIFSVSIWKSDVVNFSYQPHVKLKDQRVCVTGKIKNYQGVPSMNINQEEAVQIVE